MISNIQFHEDNEGYTANGSGALGVNVHLEKMEAGDFSKARGNSGMCR